MAGSDLDAPGGISALVDAAIDELEETPEAEPRAELDMSKLQRRAPSSGASTVLIDAQQLALDHAVAASVSTGVRPAPSAPPPPPPEVQLAPLAADLAPPPRAQSMPRGSSMPRIIMGTPTGPPPPDLAPRPRQASLRVTPLPPIPKPAPATRPKVPSLLIALAAAVLGFALAYWLFAT